MGIKRIYMDRHTLATNKRDGKNLPAIVVRTSEGPYRGTQVLIDGRSRIIQESAPNKLAGGASVYIMTAARVSVHQEDGSFVSIT